MYATWQNAYRALLKKSPGKSSHHDALVQVSFHDIGRKLSFLHRLLKGEICFAKSAQRATFAKADHAPTQQLYMPNRPLALVERAQAAIKIVANGCNYAISSFSRGWDNGRFWSHQEERT